MTDYFVQVDGHFENGEAWTWGLHVTSNQTESALTTTMVAALTDFWNNATYGLNTQYVPTTVMDQVSVSTLDGTMKQRSRTTGTLALAGTASSENALPNATSMVIHKESPGLGRWQHGFNRLPAPVEGIVVNGVYSSTSVTRFGNAFRALKAAINADGSTIFVHTGKNGAEKGLIPPYTKTVITAVQASNKPGSVRARTRKFKATLG